MTLGAYEYAVVFVCPFKVYLILLYIQITLLSSTFFNYFRLCDTLAQD